MGNNDTALRAYAFPRCTDTAATGPGAAAGTASRAATAAAASAAWTQASPGSRSLAPRSRSVSSRHVTLLSLDNRYTIHISHSAPIDAYNATRCIQRSLARTPRAAPAHGVRTGQFRSAAVVHITAQRRLGVHCSRNSMVRRLGVHAIEHIYESYTPSLSCPAAIAQPHSLVRRERPSASRRREGPP